MSSSICETQCGANGVCDSFCGNPDALFFGVQDCDPDPDCDADPCVNQCGDNFFCNPLCGDPVLGVPLKIQNCPKDPNCNGDETTCEIRCSDEEICDEICGNPVLGVILGVQDCDIGPVCQQNCEQECAQDGSCNPACRDNTPFGIQGGVGNCQPDPDCPVDVTACEVICGLDNLCNEFCATTLCGDDPDCKNVEAEDLFNFSNDCLEECTTFNQECNEDCGDPTVNDTAQCLPDFDCSNGTEFCDSQCAGGDSCNPACGVASSITFGFSTCDPDPDCELRDENCDALCGTDSQCVVACGQPEGFTLGINGCPADPDCGVEGSVRRAGQCAECLSGNGCNEDCGSGDLTPCGVDIDCDPCLSQCNGGNFCNENCGDPAGFFTGIDNCEPDPDCQTPAPSDEGNTPEPTEDNGNGNNDGGALLEVSAGAVVALVAVMLIIVFALVGIIYVSCKRGQNFRKTVRESRVARSSVQP